MRTLGIETSCDETSVAVVDTSRRILSNVVFSQVALHGPYGGVVPEIASRSHVERLPGIAEEALRHAGVAWRDIDSVAVTYGPGLASSLLVGIAFAKGMALSLGVPLCAVNHIEAHIYSPFLRDGAPDFASACPFVSLVVSGGHTSLFKVKAFGDYQLLGQTIDDAAGEAFDKGANILGLGYPGGPVIDRVARQGNRELIAFPRGLQRKATDRIGTLRADLCFSFSGLKTALLYHVRGLSPTERTREMASIVASYQEAIVDALVQRCDRATEDVECLSVGGGVSLNSRLRERLSELAEARGMRLLLAPPALCADNAAMIAGVAAAGGGVRGSEAFSIDAVPNAAVGA